MIACIDVGYRDDVARAACVTFRQWEDVEPCGEHVVDVRDVERYVPGQFYRRELPCVLAVLAKLGKLPGIVIVDGYVWLDAAQRRKGLGGHLYEALGQAVSVIGVAKRRFATAAWAVPVFRGSSDRPLFVTSAGVDQAVAADCIRRMAGHTRIPLMLKRVDRLSRWHRIEGTA